MMTSSQSTNIPAHNVFTFNDIVFSSNFDNGNLARMERIPNKSHDFKIWTAPDNLGSSFQSKHCAWFFFTVTGLPMGCVLRIQVANCSNHSGLYKYDMRPVYRSNSTNQRWQRVKSSVRYVKTEESPQMFFEHGVDVADDKLSFAFTYPYTYSMMQADLAAHVDTHVNDYRAGPDAIFCQRELIAESCEKRRIDLLTITSMSGRSEQHESLMPSLFPDSVQPDYQRPFVFPEKEVIFVSARVHPGEVPAQHTFRGILLLLMDPEDKCARALRARYVFKLIPMLNPDGVYRGHFRMDQWGNNLNRYYVAPDPIQHPSIFAAKSQVEFYADSGKLVLYLDLHAHASKRGCFIYGNVLDTIEDQIQNQLYCKLISMNTPHFDYEGCLFSKEHMFRTDPGDQAKGLTAEGSGRVSTYLRHGLVHSYTLECNYNTSRVGNEVAPADGEIGGQNATPSSNFTTNPEKYTPTTYAGVGRACIIAMLDIRGHNPCPRISKSKFKTMDRLRNTVMMEVRAKKEFLGKQMARRKSSNNTDDTAFGGSSSKRPSNTFLQIEDAYPWRRVAVNDSSSEMNSSRHSENNDGKLRSGNHGSDSNDDMTPNVSGKSSRRASVNVMNSKSSDPDKGPFYPGVLIIPMGKEKKTRRASTSTTSNNTTTSTNSVIVSRPLYDENGLPSNLIPKAGKISMDLSGSYSPKKMNAGDSISVPATPSVSEKTTKLSGQGIAITSPAKIMNFFPAYNQQIVDDRNYLNQGKVNADGSVTPIYVPLDGEERQSVSTPSSANDDKEENLSGKTGSESSEVSKVKKTRRRSSDRGGAKLLSAATKAAGRSSHSNHVANGNDSDTTGSIKLKISHVSSKSEKSSRRRRRHSAAATATTTTDAVPLASSPLADGTSPKSSHKVGQDQRGQESAFSAAKEMSSMALMQMLQQNASNDMLSLPRDASYDMHSKKSLSSGASVGSNSNSVSMSVNGSKRNNSSTTTTTNNNNNGSTKDNRKILGKTLHAAGVALIMSGPNANSNGNGGADSASTSIVSSNVAMSGVDHEHYNYKLDHHHTTVENSYYTSLNLKNRPRSASGSKSQLFQPQGASNAASTGHTDTTYGMARAKNYNSFNDAQEFENSNSNGNNMKGSTSQERSVNMSMNSLHLNPSSGSIGSDARHKPSNSLDFVLQGKNPAIAK